MEIQEQWLVLNGDTCRTFLCKEKTLVCSWACAERIFVEQQACTFVRDFFLLSVSRDYGSWGERSLY